MVCEYFGIHLTERQVVKACGISDGELEMHGLPNLRVAISLRQLGVKCTQKKNCTIAQLTKIAGVKPAIIAYTGRKNKWGHFAVLTGIDQNKLIFNDPISGRDFSLAISDFNKRWKSAYEKSDRWMCVATEK